MRDVDDQLQQVLERALGQGRATNAALDAVIADYARYHLALAVVGGLLTAALLVVVVWSVRRARRVPPREGRRWTLERVALVLLALGGGALAAMLAVVVAANIGTAAAPARGFEGAVASLGGAASGGHRAEVHGAYADWLRSGSAAMPDDVARAVAGRLDWQAPKAALTSLLLVLACAATAALLRRTVRVSRRSRPSLARSAGLLAGLAGSALVCTVLMLMVMGNSQAALAPVAITMFYG